MFDMVEPLPYRSKMVKGVPHGIFEVTTATKKAWVQDMVIVDKLKVSIPVPVQHQLLPFVLEAHGVVRDMWAHPMPHDFGPVHGTIGSDLYDTVTKDKWARLTNYPHVKIQNSNFGVVISGCLCELAALQPRNMLNP